MRTRAQSLGDRRQGYLAHGSQNASSGVMSRTATREADTSAVSWAKFWFVSIVLLAGGALPGNAVAKPLAGNIIEVWVRGASAGDNGRAVHARSQRLNLDKLPLRNVERYDAQYEQRRDYRGISLRDLLGRVAPEPTLDLAILHCSNGMAIPVPFRDGAVMDRLDVFIARATRAGPEGTLSIGKFPAIPKKDVRVDEQPIIFSGNKLVVAERWHPAVAPAAQPGFSPWAHADALTGIELVAAQPYNAQFDVGGDASVGRGLALFRQSCQFCHGVRYTGASFGWDFVESTPIYSSQGSAANLYHRVAYKPRNAAALGLMMPALGFMTEADAEDMRQWLQAIATTPMPAYAPPPRPRR